MNDENLNLQIKAFCEEINKVLQIKRNFVKNAGIIDDKDISDEDMENSEAPLAEISLEQNETMGKINYEMKKIDGWSDVSDIDDDKQVVIQMVNYSKQHNDINSFPDEMPGEIVLNLGCRMRIIYKTDDDTVDFWILDIFQEEPWRLYVHKKIKVDKGVNEDEIKNIITAMLQENAGQQSLEKRVIKLRNLSLFNKKIKIQNENTKK